MLGHAGCYGATIRQHQAVTRQEAFGVSSSTPEQVQAARPGGDPPPPPRRGGLYRALLLATVLTVARWPLPWPSRRT